MNECEWKHNAWEENWSSLTTAKARATNKNKNGNRAIFWNSVNLSQFDHSTWPRDRHPAQIASNIFRHECFENWDAYQQLTTRLLANSTNTIATNLTTSALSFQMKYKSISRLPCQGDLWMLYGTFENCLSSTWILTQRHSGISSHDMNDMILPHAESTSFTSAVQEWFWNIIRNGGNRVADWCAVLPSHTAVFHRFTMRFCFKQSYVQRTNLITIRQQVETSVLTRNCQRVDRAPSLLSSLDEERSSNTDSRETQK